MDNILHILFAFIFSLTIVSCSIDGENSSNSSYTHTTAPTITEYSFWSSLQEQKSETKTEDSKNAYEFLHFSQYQK